jgi:hypothetical protein
MSMDTLNLNPVPLTRWAINVGGLLAAGEGLSPEYLAAVRGLLAEGWLVMDAATHRAVATPEGQHQVAVDDVIRAVEGALRLSPDLPELLDAVESYFAQEA